MMHPAGHMPNDLPSFFSAPVPIWAGDRRIPNRTLGVRWPLAEIASGDPITVRVAAANSYRLWADNRWIGGGPARTAHG